jgi:uncharacterized protein YhbP (UPF0306 family)
LSRTGAGGSEATAKRAARTRVPPDAAARAAAYLRDCHGMTRATQGPDGVCAAAVFYASDAFTLYFVSAPSTRHARNVRANPRVAVTVQKDYRDWRRIRGVQLEGEAREVAAGEREHVLRLYAAKFPVVAQADRAPAAIAEAFARIRFYTIVPVRAYFVDNARGFGHRDEIDLSV